MCTYDHALTNALSLSMYVPGVYAAQALKAATFLQSGKRNQKITFDD